MSKADSSQQTHARVMAVDPGEARIGLALSDPTATLASPLAIIKHVARDDDAARIAALAVEHEAGLIIVGQALDSEGRPGLQARKARRLAAAIRDQSAISVKLWDESGSSQATQQARLDLGLGQQSRQQPLDDEAAAFILQTYLDAQREK